MTLNSCKNIGYPLITSARVQRLKEQDLALQGKGSEKHHVGDEVIIRMTTG